jgi:hypothetical protein
MGQVYATYVQGQQQNTHNAYLFEGWQNRGAEMAKKQEIEAEDARVAGYILVATRMNVAATVLAARF